MRRKPKAFALISAVFILVILALVGSFIVSIGSISGSSSTFAIQGVRAYFAARAGAEWGLHQVITTDACPGTTTINMTESGLNGFRAIVSCSQTSYTEGLSTYNVFEITSIGRKNSFGSADYVSRRVRVSATLGN